jgi:hypothetical protein
MRGKRWRISRSSTAAASTIPDSRTGSCRSRNFGIVEGVEKDPVEPLCQDLGDELLDDPLVPPPIAQVDVACVRPIRVGTEDESLGCDVSKVVAPRVHLAKTEIAKQDGTRTPSGDRRRADIPVKNRDIVTADLIADSGSIVDQETHVLSRTRVPSRARQGEGDASKETHQQLPS